MIYINEVLESSECAIHIHVDEIKPGGINIIYTETINIPNKIKSIVLNELHEYIQTKHPEAKLQIFNLTEMKSL